ncbi:MAG TPA: glycosyltransferase family 39 protein [Gemmatimonadaceae bacterium]|nr:glycosyltransferase family 39 protein [Gemmatimonadaceae bacterium]
MRRLRTPLVIAAFAVLLFAPGITWGVLHVDERTAERGWAVDDEAPLGLLAEIHNIVAPEGYRNLGYPLFYAFASGAVYAPYLGYLAVTGKLQTPSSHFPYGLAEPTRTVRVLALLSKGLTMLLAVAVVLGAWYFARTAWDPTTGVLAAAFVALTYPLGYYARTGNVDVPMLAPTALALAAYAYMVRDGITPRRAVALGIGVGLALATKEAALGLFLAFPLAVPFIRPARHPGGAPGPAVDWRSWGIAATTAFLALGVGSGFFVDPGRYLDHLRFLAGRVDMLPESAVLTTSFPMTLAGHRDYLAFLAEGLPATLTLPGVILAGMGIAWAWRRSTRTFLLVLPAVTYLAFIFLLLRVGQLRYLLPLAVILAIFAAVGLVAGARTRHPVVRGASILLGGLALGTGLLRHADLTHAMLNDSRYEAERWLAAQLRPGDRIEYFGATQKLPRLPTGVEIARATRYRGMFATYDTSAARAEEIFGEWNQRQPRFVLLIPDHSTRSRGDPYDATVPPALYRALESGEAPYRRVAFFHTPPLFPFVRRPPLDYPSVNPPVRIYAR